MLQILLNGIIVGGIYALISIGFNLIFSSVRFYHLAYGTLAVLCSYFIYSFQQMGLHFVSGTILASLIGGVLGVLFWFICYAPLKKRNASDLSIVVGSFGLLIILQNVTALIYGNATKSISVTDEIVPGYNFFGLSITFNQIIILITTLVLVLIFELLLQKTKLGQAIRAVGQNKDLAKTVGIKAEHIIVYTFFIGTFLSVIGAGLIGLEIGLKPTYGLILILKVLIACIIGGMGSVKGAMAGGLILGIAENVGIYTFGAVWQDTTAFLLLIIFLLFKPRGLFAK